MENGITNRPAALVTGASKGIGAAVARAFPAAGYDVRVYLQEAARRMRTDSGGQGGAIVNISSVAAVLGSPGEYVHYAASKAAVETLSIGACLRKSELHIQHNSYCSWWTDTLK